jgi:hypothetical protein
VTGWSAPEGAGPTSPTPPDLSAPWATAPSLPAPPPAPPRPGIIPLRPLGVGEILDGSFTAIRTAPIASLGIAAIVMLVNQAIFLLMNYLLLRPVRTTTSVDGTTVADASDAAARVGTVYIVTAFITSVELLLLTGVMAAIIGDRVVGKRVTLKDARARLRPVAWPLLRVVALVTLIVAGTVALALGPGLAASAGGADSGGPALIGIGFLLLIVPVLYAWTTLSLAPAAVVLERHGARAALRRSRKLVHGAWWRVFWVSLLAWVIAYLVTVILSLPFLIFGGGLSSVFSGRSDNLSFINLLMSALGGFVGGTLARPFHGGVSALLYIDRRMRAEGLDMALHQASTEATGISIPS